MATPDVQRAAMLNLDPNDPKARKSGMYPYDFAIPGEVNDPTPPPQPAELIIKTDVPLYPNSPVSENAGKPAPEAKVEELARKEKKGEDVPVQSTPFAAYPYAK